MEVTTSLETEVSTTSNVMVAIFVLIMTIVPPGVRGLKLIHTDNLDKLSKLLNTSQHTPDSYIIEYVL